MHKDGFLPESLTGSYEGMFPRTTGALVSLFLETGRYKDAELNIRCVLDALKENGMERMPRIIGKREGKYVIVDDQFQIDGQAHVVLAWARLALKRGHTTFEDDTWPQVSAIMARTCDHAERQLYLHRNRHCNPLQCFLQGMFLYSRNVNAFGAKNGDVSHSQKSEN